MSHSKNQRLYVSTIDTARKLTDTLNDDREGQKRLSVPEVFNAAILLAEKNPKRLKL